MKSFYLKFTAILLLAFTFYFTSCKKENAVGHSNITASNENESLAAINNKIMVGSHLNIDSLTLSASYNQIATQEFNCGQALWYARYGGWNGPFDYDFTHFNKTVNWMLANNKIPMMHMLTGPNQYMPDWLVNGTWTNAQLDTLLKRMIYAFMDANNNKNKVDVWNVVNEAFNYDNGFYQTDVIWNQLGWEADKSGLTGTDKINNMHPVYIRKAFQYCRDKTNKKLELRDYNIENNNPEYGWDDKHKGFYQLVKHMLNSGIPIDAVGIQAHHDSGGIDWLTQNNDLQNTIAKFKALGIAVYITEMDMAVRNNWNLSAARQQKKDYYNYVLQAIRGGAARINTWGIRDEDDHFWLTYDHPLLWDENSTKKPAYYGVKQALLDSKNN